MSKDIRFGDGEFNVYTDGEEESDCKGQRAKGQGPRAKGEAKSKEQRAKGLTPFVLLALSPWPLALRSLPFTT